jgi:hypothetical protein
MPNYVRVSHSTIRNLISCPRKRLFQDKLRLFPTEGSIAMRYGSGFHKGMEGYYKHGKDLIKGMEAAAEFWKQPTIQNFSEDFRNLESLLNSISIYHDQYRNDSEEVIDVPEKKIVTRILLTDEEKSCYGDMVVDFVVVIDLILSSDGMLWVIDFKTTGVNLAFIASRLRRMPQLMGYQFTAADRYEGISGTMIYYHQLSATKSRTTGLYGTTKTDFMKMPQVYSHKDYSDWRKYIIWNAYCLMKAEEAGYPPNYNSCYEFNKACEYLPLCDYPKWDIERFMEMDGFVVVPDDRDATNYTSSLP